MARENTMEATYSLRWVKYSTTDASMNRDCTKLRAEAKSFNLGEKPSCKNRKRENVAMQGLGLCCPSRHKEENVWQVGGEISFFKILFNVNII